LVIVEARFSLTPAATDFAAAQLIQTIEVDRAGVLLYSSAGGEGTAQEIVDVATSAATALHPADLRWNGSRISVFARSGTCVAAFFPLDFAECTGGSTLRAPIRAAYQVVDAPARLQAREEAPPPAVAVQVIALGKQATIVAAGGAAPAFGVPPISDERVAAALKRALARAGR
jgi:hypothetical protein